jgi:BirA family biotin operon repressor/biotin-[acetyl-CoA-carboxylase] ligase
MQLDPAAAAAGFRLFDYETLPSTNTQALILARRGESAPFWVTAREQSAGHGRRGNAWVSAPGNLYATVLVRDPAPPATAPQLSFVVALAVYDAIGICVEALGKDLALKWPNDVLCGGKKLAGILIESEGAGESLTAAAGIGVNCASHPADTSYPATDLAAEGARVSAGDLFYALSGTMLARLKQWHRGSEFRSIRADWLARASGLDGEIRVRLPDRELNGRCGGLDEHGRLALRLGDGSLQMISAGDVFPIAVKAGMT